MTRSVVVTGGFGVLGQAVAEAFAAAGDKVARLDFTARAQEDISGSFDIGGGDLTDAQSTSDAIARVIAAHDGVDVLVNVARSFRLGTGGERKHLHVLENACDELADERDHHVDFSA